MFAFTMQTRQVDVHPVMSHELDQLRNASPAYHIAFFGIAFGSFLSLLIVVLSQTRSANGHDTFVAMLWASGILAAYFAVAVWRARKVSGELIASIKRRQTTSHPMETL